MSFLARRDVIRDVFAIQRGYIERAFAMLFSRSFLIACIDCKEIAAVASRRETSKRNFHPDRACYLATGLPVESGTSFLRSLDDFEMSLAQPIAFGVAIVPHALRKEAGLIIIQATSAFHQNNFGIAMSPDPFPA